MNILFHRPLTSFLILIGLCARSAIAHSFIHKLFIESYDIPGIIL